MAKRGRTLFSRVFIISMCILFLNVILIFIRNFRSGGVALTGKSITSVISNAFSMSLFLKIALVVQVVFLVGILLYTLSYDKKLRTAESAIIMSRMRKSGPNETDLDVLYEALKKHGELSLSSIAISFKINKDVAMEWCKILESGDLAVIDYPGFGEPSIRPAQADNIPIKELPESKETKANIEEIKKATEEPLNDKPKKRKIKKKR
jgi:hypothetical protein